MARADIEKNNKNPKIVCVTEVSLEANKNIKKAKRC